MGLSRKDFFVWVAAVVLACNAAQGQTTNIRYVAPDGVDNDPTLHPGTSWGTAWHSLSYALERLSASSPGFNQIRIKRGESGYVYKPGTNSENSFTITKSVTIIGGYDENGEREEGDVTTLSGDLEDDHHIRHIMILDGTGVGQPVTLKGLRFIHGNGCVEDQDEEDEDTVVEGGGALWGQGVQTGTFFHGPVYLEECVFEENEGEDWGGAVYLYFYYAHASKCRFVGNLVHGNPPDEINSVKGQANGGAVALIYSNFGADRTTFSGNSLINAGGGGGGAIWSGDSLCGLRCVNCTFEDNLSLPSFRGHA